MPWNKNPTDHPYQLGFLDCEPAATDRSTHSATFFSRRLVWLSQSELQIVGSKSLALGVRGADGSMLEQLDKGSARFSATKEKHRAECSMMTTKGTS